MLPLLIEQVNRLIIGPDGIEATQLNSQPVQDILMKSAQVIPKYVGTS